MKSERRHELQTNSLALWLRWKAPEFWEKHGTKVLLVLVVIALAVVLVRWLVEGPKRAAEQAKMQLAEGRQLLQDYHVGAINDADADDIRSKAEMALKLSQYPAVQAAAYNLQGDYYWVRATNVNPSTSRPTSAELQTRADSLKAAQESYEKTLAMKDVPVDLLGTANISLGKIHEQMGAEAMREAGNKITPQAQEHFAKARQYFETVAKAADMLQVHKLLAERDLQFLEEVQQPVFSMSEADAKAKGFAVEPVPRATTQSSPQTAPATAPGHAPTTGKTAAPGKTGQVTPTTRPAK